MIKRQPVCKRLPWTGRRLVVAVVFALCASGCVGRRMTIVSDPPGAMVYVDNYEIGTTPVSTDFIYYGTRQIRLVKSGYETLEVEQPIPAPWYEIPPLDFFSENVVPTEIRDERLLRYQLRPQMVVPTQQLLSRAENLRRANHPPGSIPPLAPGEAAPQILPTPGTP